MSRSTSTRNRRFRRIALAGVAAALLVPAVASAEAPTVVERPAPALRDVPPADPTQTAPEVISGPATLPDLPLANPTQVAPVGQPTGNGGFDFGDAAIGVAVVAGFCAALFALAAFLMGRRRRLGASHS